MDRGTGVPMTNNSTWGGMIAMGLRYHVHCERCERYAEIDMTKLPPDGPSINRTFRCNQCGGPGRSVVSARSADRAAAPARPLPQVDGALFSSDGGGHENSGTKIRRTRRR